MGNTPWGSTIPQHSQVRGSSRGGVAVLFGSTGETEVREDDIFDQDHPGGVGGRAKFAFSLLPSPGKGAPPALEKAEAWVGAQISGGLARVPCKVPELS